jgi:hypothetical protein
MLRGAGDGVLLRGNFDMVTNIDRPGDEYPPSRPGLKTMLGALVVILAGLAIAFWPQILGAMGFHVAPPPGGG